MEPKDSNGGVQSQTKLVSHSLPKLGSALRSKSKEMVVLADAHRPCSLGNSQDPAED